MRTTDPETRRRDLFAEFTTRLTRFRGRLTDAEFEQLIADMVRTAERFTEIDERPLRPAQRDEMRPRL